MKNQKSYTCNGLHLEKRSKNNFYFEISRYKNLTKICNLSGSFFCPSDIPGIYFFADEEFNTEEEKDKNFYMYSNCEIKILQGYE